MENERKRVFVSRILLAVFFCFASFDCFAQEDIASSDSIPNTVNDIRRQEMRRKEVAALETHLQGQGIAMNKEGIQEYLQQLDDLTVAKKLIFQLGSDRFAEREAAQQALMKLPAIPIALLREASQSSDPERAFRAKRILKKAAPQQLETVEKILRAIELLKIPGLAKEVLAAGKLRSDGVPATNTPAVMRQRGDLLNLVRAALLQTVTAKDVPRLASVIDNEPTLRIVAIHALSAKSLASVEGVLDKLEEVWKRGKPADRLAATEVLLFRGDRRALGRFVTLLESDDFDVRYRAANRLWSATGQRFAFDGNGPAEERLKQVAVWRAWIESSGETAQFRTDVVFTRTWARTLVWRSLGDHDFVVEYDLAGNETWRVELQDPRECWGMASGERVVRCWEPKAEKYLIVYAAGDGVPRELWSLDYVCEARPLLSGDILVWSSNEQIIRKYDRKGGKLWEAEVVWKGKKRSPLYADQLSNGNFRVLFWENPKLGPQIADTAIEIDQRGQVVRDLPYDPKVKLLQRLPSGNALVRIEEDNGVRGKRLEERDPAGKVVWSRREGGLVMSAQRLPNGDTFVAVAKMLGTSAEIKVIRPDGAVGWSKVVGYWPDEAYRY